MGSTPQLAVPSKAGKTMCKSLEKIKHGYQQGHLNFEPKFGATGS